MTLDGADGVQHADNSLCPCLTIDAIEAHDNDCGWARDPMLAQMPEIKIAGQHDTAFGLGKIEDVTVLLPPSISRIEVTS
jgi:hypothetical protein